MADYVSLTDQRRMTISLPSIEKQIAIAYVLAALDDKIKLNQQINQTLEHIAQALFKSWFVDFDPVVAKAAGKRPSGMSDEVAALFPDISLFHLGYPLCGLVDSMFLVLRRHGVH